MVSTGVPTYADVSAKSEAKIIVSKSGLVTFIEVDNVCVLRIFTNGMVPITIEDKRPDKEK